MQTAPLTHKERLRRALRHEPVDRLPTQINYTAGMGEKLAAHFEVSQADLPELLDNHLVRVDLSYPERLSEDGTIRFDWWGAGHDTGEEGYFIRSSPLANSKDLEAFAWPDPQRAGSDGRSATRPSKNPGRNTSSRPTWALPCSSEPGRCAGWSNS